FGQYRGFLARDDGPRKIDAHADRAKRYAGYPDGRRRFRFVGAGRGLGAGGERQRDGGDEIWAVSS
ncbi:hypothetical protein, partial [Streptococcus pneumoniae]|uniref:hypothetical protein n=1 Tax=Streptococcus pneumoniae TaxID=1313 RepID=UPI00195480A0